MSEPASSRVGWVRLPSWRPADACEAPRHLSAPPPAEWMVALTHAAEPGEAHALCDECVAAIAASLGITVEGGVLTPPPLL